MSVLTKNISPEKQQRNLSPLDETRRKLVIRNKFSAKQTVKINGKIK